MSESARFAGKIAVVTGGSSGIGRALARLLKREGAKVVILDIAPDETGEFDVARAVDITIERDVVRSISEIATRYDSIDLLANCAGIGHRSLIVDTSLESWNKVLSVNLTGMFLVSREVAKAMSTKSSGSIVNIASVDAHAADPHYGSYNASKAGVLGLTRSLAIELASLGIRANSVSPGLVMTPMISRSAENPATLDHIQNDFRRVPIKRVLSAEEVARACAYLLSDDAQGITGSDLIIDGGMMADSYLMNSLPS